MSKTYTRKEKKVRFQMEAPPGSDVFVAGTFNNWDPTCHPMRDNPDSGVFKAALALLPGRHEYKFVVNGEWRRDPACAVCAPNGLGSLNSVVTV